MPPAQPQPSRPISLLILSLLCILAFTDDLGASLIQHLDSSTSANVSTTGSKQVTTWNDTSGNSNHSVAKVGVSNYPASDLFPTNRAGVAFGPSRSSLQLLNASTTDALLDFTGAASGNTGFAVMVTLRVETLKTDEWNDLLGVTSSFTDGGFSLRYSQGGVIQINMGGNAFRRPTSDAKIASGDSVLIIVNYDAATGKLELWDSLNQTTVSWNQPAGDFSVGGDGTLRLGEMGNASRFIIGAVGEVKVFNSTLSQTEFSNVVAAASQTWITEPGPAAFQHLDAASVADGPVTQWTDQSGNARHATSAAGSVTFPGSLLFSSDRAGINFGEQQNILQLLDATSAGDVFDFTAGASGNSGFSVLWAARVDLLRTNDWNDLIGTTSNGTGGGFGMRYSGGGRIQAYMGGVATLRPESDREVQTGTSVVLALNYDAASGVVTLWDSLNGTEATWTVSAGDFVDNALTLGGTGYGSRFFDGSVGEVKIYDRNLTATEFKTQREAMTLKWVGIAPANPAIPAAPKWTIDQLLNWDPATDPDAPFNVSTVPLQSRIDVPAALKANSNAKSGQGGIQALDVFAGTLPQGGPGGQNLFTFTYWQYLQESVYWGGIGNINFVPPTAEMIDNAHRNGVPILGTVFFPPLVYGGNYQWVQTFLTKVGDTYPAADKLIETAEYYGFDGWFINQETEGGTAADAAAMRDLIRYIRENSDITIRWYDSMREDGIIAWQDHLNGNNDWYLRHNYSLNTQNDWGKLIAHGMFVDFIDYFDPNNPTLLTSLSRTRAQQLALDPYQIFTGQEAEANNFKTSTNPRLRMSNVFPDGQDHITSAGIYKTAKYATEIADQDLFWSGASGDPRNTSATVQTGTWRGIAHNIAARSAITSLPLATEFNIGKGDKYYLDGSVVQDSPWYNRALQSILPTWRWIIDSSGTKLTPTLFTGDSFQGGSCLRVSGNLNAPNTLRLYLTDLPVTAITRLTIVYKRPGQSGVDSFMEVGVSTSTAPTSFTYYDAGTCEVDGWNTTTIDLGSLAGSVIRAINLKFDSPTAIANYDIRIGRISIYDASTAAPESPTNIQAVDVASWAGFASGRVSWDHPPGAIHSYNVYLRLVDGSLQFIGSTASNYYYFENIAIPDAFEAVVVQTVAPDLSQSLLSDETRPHLTLTPISENLIRLSWPAVTGAVLETTTNLALPASWQEITGYPIQQQNGTNSVEIPTGSNESRFFRLRW